MKDADITASQNHVCCKPNKFKSFRWVSRAFREQKVVIFQRINLSKFCLNKEYLNWHQVVDISKH